MGRIHCFGGLLSLTNFKEHELHNRRPWKPWGAWDRATAQPRFPSSKLANSTRLPKVITLALNSSTRLENEGKASAECSCGAGSDRIPLQEVDP